MKPFANSTFVVAWSGEAENSHIFYSWEAVLTHLDEETGVSDTSGGDSFREANNLIHDPEEWTRSDIYLGVTDPREQRMTYRAQVDECVYLTIIRVLDETTTRPEDQMTTLLQKIEAFSGRHPYIVLSACLAASICVTAFCKWIGLIR